jgi:hypothetical protein
VVSQKDYVKRSGLAVKGTHGERGVDCSDDPLAAAFLEGA